MSKKSLLYSVLPVCGILLFPLAGLAASALSISSPSADGVFVLQGTGLRNVSGMELSVSYDTATLANPRVQMGGLVRGMVSAVNSTNPLRLAILSGSESVTGDGTIATITFDRLGSSPGKITSLKGDLRDLKGEKLSSQAFVVDGGFTADRPHHAEDVQTPADPNVDDPSAPPPQQDPSQPYVGGTVTMPEENPPAPEPADVVPPQPEEPQQVPEWDTGSAGSEAPAPDAEMEAPPPAAAPLPPLAQGEARSVLERFRLHQGEKSPQQLLSLFQQPEGGPYDQYPPVALSDGKETLTLVIRNVPAGVTPKFLFESARFVSLGKGEKGEWEVEVRPEQGALRASAKALMNDKWEEIPLTVAPKVELAPGGGVTEAELATFLKERGTEAAPKHDLNGDGKRDYVDDYIYCANYLVMQRAKKKQQNVPR